GLKRVDEGQLDRNISVETRDEFSNIANGFNRMISSLDEARQRTDEQTDLLESEIQYRTIEAAKKIDPDILSKDQVFENKLRETIESNLSDFDFQVAELAEAMAVSTRQLHRRVVNLTAQTPASLIRSFRLEHGYQLLSARAVNVSEAAYGCGFKDVSYFSKLFHKKYGVAPSEFLSSE
ncbi:MAG: helix-turn-helix domain-containing protein, partial [Kordiimonas sp.]